MVNILKIDGIVHHEFISQGQNMNLHFYTGILWFLVEDV
jgi:hypothetical protein